MLDKIQLKPYPHPVIEGTSTRFSAGFTGAGREREEMIRPAQFDYELCSFVYDSAGENGPIGVMKPLKNDQGEVIRIPEALHPYIPGQDLIDLVRLAQVIRRPVLLKGEPGSGKTQLARSVAYEWYGPEYHQHFFEWHIKSTSKAVEGLYAYDHVARLRNAQLGKNAEIKLTADKKEDPKQYRSFGPLAKAFLTSTPDKPSILLIDEIDKADIDFPNDLLLELDEGRFTIPETGELIRAQYPPLIFITSNDERELPEAFLRRCLFMYIKFPGDTQLQRIISAHLPDLMRKQKDFVLTAIKRFHDLRESNDKDPTDNKRVSTSELLDWLTAYYYQLEYGGGISARQLEKKGLEDLPLYYQTLLKTYAAYKREREVKKRK